MARRTIAGVAGVLAPHVSDEEWLARPEDARQTEWVDGEVILCVPPQTIHALVSALLLRLIAWFVDRKDLGLVMAAPFEMRLSRSAREPDVIFVAAANLSRLGDSKLHGPADLAVEIVSDASVTRDRVEKRAEYEAAGVPEYWILDPRPGRFAFETLVLGEEGRYAPTPPDSAGRYHATVLPGFWLGPAWFRDRPLPKLDVPIDAILAGGEQPAP